LEIWLELCRSFRIDEVLVNVHSHAELVRLFLVHRQGLPKVKLVEETALLGSAGTLRANRAWVQPEPFFWVFYADVLTDIDLGPMLEVHRTRNPAATLGIYRVPDPSRCGVVELAADGTVNQFIEKPSNPKTNLAFSGVLIGTTDLLDAIPVEEPADIGFDVLPRLTGRMIGYQIEDYLLDIGTTENYEQAQNTWPGLEGEPSSSHVSRNCV
jgi:mannose-1-phosphate guanylyltransferase